MMVPDPGDTGTGSHDGRLVLQLPRTSQGCDRAFVNPIGQGAASTFRSITMREGRPNYTSLLKPPSIF